MKTWMADNFQLFKDVGLHNLVLPGTHDSGAYQVDFKHSKHKLPMFAACIKPWTVTQIQDIYQQLAAKVSRAINPQLLTRYYTAIIIPIYLIILNQFLQDIIIRNF